MPNVSYDYKFYRQVKAMGVNRVQIAGILRKISPVHNYDGKHRVAVGRIDTYSGGGFDKEDNARKWFRSRVNFVVWNEKADDAQDLVPGIWVRGEGVIRFINKKVRNMAVEYKLGNDANPVDLYALYPIGFMPEHLYAEGDRGGELRVAPDGYFGGEDGDGEEGDDRPFWVKDDGEE